MNFVIQAILALALALVMSFQSDAAEKKKNVPEPVVPNQEAEKSFEDPDYIPPQFRKPKKHLHNLTARFGFVTQSGNPEVSSPGHLEQDIGPSNVIKAGYFYRSNWLRVGGDLCMTKESASKSSSSYETKIETTYTTVSPYLGFRWFELSNLDVGTNVTAHLYLNSKSKLVRSTGTIDLETPEELEGFRFDPDVSIWAEMTINPNLSLQGEFTSFAVLGGRRDGASLTGGIVYGF